MHSFFYFSSRRFLIKNKLNLDITGLNIPIKRYVNIYSTDHVLMITVSGSFQSRNKVYDQILTCITLLQNSCCIIGSNLSANSKPIYMRNNASIRLLNNQDLQKSFIVDGPKKLLLDYVMPSELAALADLAAEVDKTLPEETALAFQVNLCLEELITNVIKYGLAGADEHFIQLQIYAHEKFLEIFLKDDAPQFDPFAEAPSPDMNLDVEHRPIGGLGIHFVKTIMNKAKAYYDDSGNLIVLLKNL